MRRAIRFFTVVVLLVVFAGPAFAQQSIKVQSATITGLTANSAVAADSNSKLVAVAPQGAGYVLGGVTSAPPSMQQKTDKFAFASGIAPTASLVLGPLDVPVAETLPTNCTGTGVTSVADAVVTSAGTATFTIYKWSAGTSTSIGTVVWSASTAQAAFTCTATTFAAHDMVYIVSPASPDATLAELGITLMMKAGAL